MPLLVQQEESRSIKCSRESPHFPTHRSCILWLLCNAGKYRAWRTVPWQQNQQQIHSSPFFRSLKYCEYLTYKSWSPSFASLLSTWVILYFSEKQRWGPFSCTICIFWCAEGPIDAVPRTAPSSRDSWHPLSAAAPLRRGNVQVDRGQLAPSTPWSF